MYLNGNPVKTVNGAHNLTNVTYVNGNKCGFKSIPEWIQELTGLERLLLENNRISEIPSWMKEMKKIELLDLQSNRIMEIPSWICEMDRLKELWLYDNQVTTIPSLAKGKMRLEVLKLGGNRNLQLIPSLGENLKVLVIWGCDIRSLPHDLFHHELQMVNMNNNKGESSWEFRSV